MILSKYIFSAIFIPVVILSGCSLNSHIEKNSNTLPSGNEEKGQENLVSNIYLENSSLIDETGKQNTQLSQEELEQAAYSGDINSQTMLGVLYAEGRGVKQDYQKAKM